MFRKILLIIITFFTFSILNVTFSDYIENSRWTLFDKETWIALPPEEAAQIRAEEAARLKAWNTASMEPLKQGSTSWSSDDDIAKADYEQLKEQWLSDEEARKQSWYNGWNNQQQSTNSNWENKCSPWKICSPDFTINTDTFSVWWKSLKSQTTAKDTINKTLWTFIKKLMIALWVISLLIMTIWTWYIILYHGEDEYLSKWKSIFTAWIIALIISLSSYYMVNLVGYILYK